MLLLRGLRQSARALPVSSLQILPELTLQIFDECLYKEKNKPAARSVISPDQGLPAVLSAPAPRVVVNQLLQTTGEPHVVTSACGVPELAGHAARAVAVIQAPLFPRIRPFSPSPQSQTSFSV